MPNSAAELFVTKKNVSLFYELLLAPIATWLKEEKMVIAVSKKAELQWEPTSLWLRGTKENLGNFGLDEQYNLIVNDQSKIQPGYPFGFTNEIDSEQNPERKAYKILWNILYSEAQVGDLLYGMDIFWMSARAVHRRASGLIYRQSLLTPNQNDVGAEGTLSFSGPNDLLRREVLRLSSPPVVYGYAQVSWRYRGEGEDRLWIYSPVMGRSREVLASNRSDPILQGILTFDDLFVWSSKIQSVNAKVVDEKTLLVPFPSHPIGRLHEELMVPNWGSEVVAGDGEKVAADPVLGVTGLFQASDGRASTMLWNFDTKRFPQFSAWVPTEIVFTPRKVWILELSPRDPYYLDGRQILIVDKETMLPIYKVVYNRRGGYQRTIIGCWSFANTEDRKVNFPFSSFVLGVEQGGTAAVGISSNFVRTFSDSSKNLKEKMAGMLEITNHSKKEPPQEEKIATPTIPALSKEEAGL